MRPPSSVLQNITARAVCPAPPTRSAGVGASLTHQACCLMSSATSSSTREAPSCCSRSSPNGRKERLSRIGTNLPFSGWGTVFPDPRPVAAIVDRVTFNAHITETGTQSYRLATSTTAARRKRTM